MINNLISISVNINSSRHLINLSCTLHKHIHPANWTWIRDFDTSSCSFSLSLSLSLTHQDTQVHLVFSSITSYSCQRDPCVLRLVVEPVSPALTVLPIARCSSFSSCHCVSSNPSSCASPSFSPCCRITFHLFLTHTHLLISLFSLITRLKFLFFLSLSLSASFFLANHFPLLPVSFDLCSLIRSTINGGEHFSLSTLSSRLTLFMFPPLQLLYLQLASHPFTLYFFFHSLDSCVLLSSSPSSFRVTSGHFATFPLSADIPRIRWQGKTYQLFH